MSILLFLVAALLPNGNTLTHEFYLSNYDFHYKSDQNTIQVSARIFIDDLENALVLQGANNPKIGTEKEIENCDLLIDTYINKNLSIAINGTSSTLSFIGKELSDDYAAIWCYFEIPNVSSLQTFTIKNSVLMEVYDDQKNMISLKKDKKKVYTWIFDKEDHKGDYAFD